MNWMFTRHIPLSMTLGLARAQLSLSATVVLKVTF